MSMKLKVLLLLLVMSAASEKINIATFEEVQTAPLNNITIIDVRQPEELIETGIIPGSINIPLAEVGDILEKLSGEDFGGKFGKTKPEFNDPIILTCRSGRRSKEAYKIAEKLGYTNLKNFDGGWLLWEQKLRDSH